MDYGAHLPVIGFGEQRWTLSHLAAYARTAEHLGFKYLCANDHFIFPRPWLDSLAAMTAVLGHTEQVSLVTSAALPVLRGPVALAKSLAAIDVLSAGRLIIGVGPGSSTRDYFAVGIPFEERWKRFDESVQALRALLTEGGKEFVGAYYSTRDVNLQPHPVQRPSPPIWIGSWGSEAGLRRAARFGDGWLASAYNTTPDAFAGSWNRLGKLLLASGKDPARFPNAISTMYCYLTENRRAAEAMVQDVLGPALNRPASDLSQRLLFGPAGLCAEKVAAYQAAGAQRIFLWPVADEVQQLEIFMDRIAPLVSQ